MNSSNNLKKKDLLIFGYGIHPKNVKRIREEHIKYSISKIAFGECHMAILYGIY